MIHREFTTEEKMKAIEFMREKIYKEMSYIPSERCYSLCSYFEDYLLSEDDDDFKKLLYLTIRDFPEFHSKINAITGGSKSHFAWNPKEAQPRLDFLKELETEIKAKENKK